MELADPGIVSVVGFGMVVVVGGLIMAALSFFSMKETKFEDVLAKQRLEQQTSEKEKPNKQKRDQLKKKSDTKKKKSQKDSKKVATGANGISPNREVQNKSAEPNEEKNNATKEDTKIVKQTPAVIEKAVASVKAPALKVAPVKEVPIVVEEQQSEPKIQKDAKNQKETKITKKVEKLQKQPAPANAEVVDAVAEVKPKKKKTKVQKEEPVINPVIEMVRSTELDDATVQALMDVLSEISGSGDWSTNSGKNKEFQKQLNSKDMKIAMHIEELVKCQQKIDSLNQVIHANSLADAERKQQIEQQMSDYSALQKELHNEKKNVLQLQTQMQVSSEKSGNVQKLKEENEILRHTIQANAQIVSDKNRLSQDLQTSQAKLSECEVAKAKLEHQLAEYSKSFQQTKVEVEKSVNQRVEDVTQKLKESQASYRKLDAEYQKVQVDLQYSQDKCAKLLDQVVELNDANDQRLESLSETKQALEQRLTEMDANDSQKAEEVAKLHTQNKGLKKQVGELTAKNEALSDEIALQRRSSNKTTDDLQKNSDVIKEKDDTITALQSSNDTYKNKVTSLESDVEKLKKKNNELREKNWKAMDAVAVAERTAKDKISASKNELTEAINSLENDVKIELSSKFSGITCSDKDFKSWLPSFLSRATDAFASNSSQNEATSEKVQELEEQNKITKKEVTDLEKRLQSSEQSSNEQNQALQKRICLLSNLLEEKEADVIKYKDILSSTEEVLSKLQGTAEKVEEQSKKEIQVVVEEKTALLKQLDEAKKQQNEAMQKVEDKSKSLKQLELECEKLKHELSESNIELSKSLEKCRENESRDNEPPTEEMHEVASAQPSSQSSSPLRVALSDADMNTDMNLVEDDQGFLVFDRLDQLNSLAPQENGQVDEVAKLKERLEKEKALTKDLGNAATKLQTVLKQTQGQLAKEREKNLDLQQQNSAELD